MADRAGYAIAYYHDNKARIAANARRCREKADAKAQAEGVFSPNRWQNKKAKAKIRGIDWQLDDRAEFKIPKECPVLGIPLDGRDQDHRPSLERIDNTKGYVKGNVIVVSYRANKLKNNATIEELERLVAFYKGIS